MEEGKKNAKRKSKYIIKIEGSKNKEKDWEYGKRHRNEEQGREAVFIPLAVLEVSEPSKVIEEKEDKGNHQIDEASFLLGRECHKEEDEEISGEIFSIQMGFLSIFLQLLLWSQDHINKIRQHCSNKRNDSRYRYG